jgi:hypothetical protein
VLSGAGLIANLVGTVLPTGSYRDRRGPPCCSVILGRDDQCRIGE